MLDKIMHVVSSPYIFSCLGSPSSVVVPGRHGTPLVAPLCSRPGDGGQGWRAVPLGLLIAANNGLEFTMSYFMVPVPLRLTALKCLALNVCLDFVLGGGRRSPAALLLSSALAASAGVAAFQLA